MGAQLQLYFWAVELGALGAPLHGRWRVNRSFGTVISPSLAVDIGSILLDDVFRTSSMQVVYIYVQVHALARPRQCIYRACYFFEW